MDIDSYADYVLLGDIAVGVDDGTISIIKVSRYILHDDTLVKIAILEMAEPVPLDQYPNIKPVCLPEKAADFSDYVGTID